MPLKEVQLAILGSIEQPRLQRVAPKKRVAPSWKRQRVPRLEAETKTAIPSSSLAGVRELFWGIKKGPHSRCDRLFFSSNAFPPVPHASTVVVKNRESRGYSTQYLPRHSALKSTGLFRIGRAYGQPAFVGLARSPTIGGARASAALSVVHVYDSTSLAIAPERLAAKVWQYSLSPTRNTERNALAQTPDRSGKLDRKITLFYFDVCAALG